MAVIQHHTLSGANLHEPWLVFADDTARLAYSLTAADVNRAAYVTSTNEVWAVDATPAWVPTLSPPRLAVISDTAITPGAPLTLPANTPIQLTNNAGVGTFGINVDPADYWNTGTNRAIVPRPQWDYVLRVDYIIVPTATATGELFFTVDIGGGLGIIFTDTRSISKGVGVQQKGTFIFNGYAGTTWAANGAILRMESTVAAKLEDLNISIKPY